MLVEVRQVERDFSFPVAPDIERSSEQLPLEMSRPPESVGNINDQDGGAVLEENCLEDCEEKFWSFWLGKGRIKPDILHLFITYSKVTEDNLLAPYL